MSKQFKKIEVISMLFPYDEENELCCLSYACEREGYTVKQFFDHPETAAFLRSRKQREPVMNEYGTWIGIDLAKFFAILVYEKNITGFEPIEKDYK